MVIDSWLRNGAHVDWMMLVPWKKQGHIHPWKIFPCSISLYPLADSWHATLSFGQCCFLCHLCYAGSPIWPHLDPSSHPNPATSDAHANTDAKSQSVVLPLPLSQSATALLCTGITCLEESFGNLLHYADTSKFTLLFALCSITSAQATEATSSHPPKQQSHSCSATTGCCPCVSPCSPPFSPIPKYSKGVLRYLWMNQSNHLTVKAVTSLLSSTIIYHDNHSALLRLVVLTS